MDISKKVINIPTSLENMYKHYLTILKPINRLRAKEIELLAYTMYLYECERDNIVNSKDRWYKIFSYEGKLKIREKLGTSDYTLNNMLSSLRKKGLIVDNTIPDKFFPKVKKNCIYQLIFNFSINESK